MTSPSPYWSYCVLTKSSCFWLNPAVFLRKTHCWSNHSLANPSDNSYFRSNSSPIDHHKKLSIDIESLSIYINLYQSISISISHIFLVWIITISPVIFLWLRSTPRLRGLRFELVARLDQLISPRRLELFGVRIFLPSYGKSIGKPWEKHRKMVIYMDSSYLGIGFNDWIHEY